MRKTLSILTLILLCIARQAAAQHTVLDNRFRISAGADYRYISFSDLNGVAVDVINNKPLHFLKNLYVAADYRMKQQPWWIGAEYTYYLPSQRQTAFYMGSTYTHPDAIIKDSSVYWDRIKVTGYSTGLKMTYAYPFRPRLSFLFGCGLGYTRFNIETSSATEIYSQYITSNDTAHYQISRPYSVLDKFKSQSITGKGFISAQYCIHRHIFLEATLGGVLAGSFLRYADSGKKVFKKADYNFANQGIVVYYYHFLNMNGAFAGLHAGYTF